MRTGVFLAVISSWLYCLSALAAVQVSLEGDQGETLTQGFGYYFDNGNARINVHHVEASRLQLSISRTGHDLFSLDFQAPHGQSLKADTYARAANRPVVNRAAMNVSGNGRFCGPSQGMFEIYELDLGPESLVSRLALDFRQQCGADQPPLFGSIRLNSQIPMNASRPFAIAGPDKGGFESDRITLNGADSFARGADIVKYRWRQTQGPAARLFSAHKPRARFVPVDVPLGGANYQFELTVTDSRGLNDSDRISVSVPSKSDPQFYISLDSPPGEWVGLGRKWRLTPEDGLLFTRGDAHGGLSMQYRGAQPPTDLLFTAPQGLELRPGGYDYAVAYQAGQSSSLPGINVRMGPRRCPQAIGRFRLLSQADRGEVADSAIALDFRQHCFPGAQALAGKLRYNAIPAEVPYARAPLAQRALAGSEVVLDAGSSWDAQQDRLAFKWQQITGQPVALTGADTAQAHFIMPEPPGTQPYRFRITVKDEKGYKASEETMVSPVNET